MTAVRILRLLEYTYPDQETADKDMGHWTVPANGHHGSWPHVTTIRSAIISQPWPDPELTPEELAVKVQDIFGVELPKALVPSINLDPEDLETGSGVTADGSVGMRRGV